MTETQLRKSSALKTLRQLAEARGLTFYVNPPREIVPEFLGDFQPDAMALGPEGGIIIEVKLQGSPASEKPLAAIARKVSGQKGWEFRAIYMNSPMDETPPIEKPTQAQLLTTFEEIAALIKGGHPAAGLVTAWAALESLARLAGGNDEARRPGGFSPIQAIQRLAEEGYIENDAADRLREMAKLRNAVVHGDFSVDVSAEKVEGLLMQLQAIMTNIETIAAEQEA